MSLTSPTPPALAIPHTLHDLLQHCQACLQHAHDTHGLAFGHGTGNARDEAAWLVLWRLGLPLDTPTDPAALSVQKPHMVTAAQAQSVIDLVTQRIATRKPVAYLTGQAWLQGVPFAVDERVIVPRSFIAEMIANAPEADSLDPWLGEHTQRVLDMCTGNGSLAVLAAMAWPEVHVDATDISTDALAVAHLNVAQHGLQDRISLLASDGWAALGAHARYDLILCNPPYVSRHRMDALPAEYLAEPRLSLDGGVHGGTDGMDFIRHFLAHVLHHLQPQGVVVLEVGNERAHFEHAFADLPCEWPQTSVGEGPLVLITEAGLRHWQSPPPEEHT